MTKKDSHRFEPLGVDDFKNKLTLLSPAVLSQGKWTIRNTTTNCHLELIQETFHDTAQQGPVLLIQQIWSKVFRMSHSLWTSQIQIDRIHSVLHVLGSSQQDLRRTKIWQQMRNMPWYPGGFTGTSSRDVAVSLKSETTATKRSRMLHQSTKQIQSELDKFLKKTFVGYCNPFHVNNPCLCFLCCCQVVGDVSKCEAVTSSNFFVPKQGAFLINYFEKHNFSTFFRPRPPDRYHKSAPPTVDPLHMFGNHSLRPRDRPRQGEFAGRQFGSENGKRREPETMLSDKGGPRKRYPE